MATSVGKVLIMPKGTWDSATTYYYLDLVTYNGSKWMCKVESCTNIEPSSANSSYWFQWDDSDVGSSAVTFSIASERTNLISGNTVAVLFGKVKKWLEDLADIAFTGNFADLSNVPTADDTTFGVVEVDGTSITSSSGVISVGSVDADDVGYDNQTSTLLATDVQDAIDELKTSIDGIEAADVSYSNTSSGLTATDVQDAIDEVADDLADTTANVTIYRDTLETGETSITFTNSAIGSNTAFNIYTDIYGVNPTAVAVSGTTLTLTFDAQTSDMVVGIQIIN